MTTSPTNTAAGIAPSRWHPLLLLLFVGSGCAALIYEIVWFQLLQLVIGSSAVSLGVLLGTFMGGMCLGSLLLPRFVPRHLHPIRVYALLELGIGILGLLVLFALPALARIYTDAAVPGFAGILLRGVMAAICLLPPTLLMGATLPAVARWIETTPRGVSWLGFFYGGNIAGAVFGCLLAGFYLLRVHDMAYATWVAIAINAAVAGIGLLISAFTPHQFAGNAAPTTAASSPAVSTPGARLVYLAIALSGLSALGAEVVWTRLLSLLLGGTVYTFSIILAVFLVGLGLGSTMGSFLAGTLKNPRLALGCCQIMVAAGITWTGIMLADSLPYWPIDPSLSKNVWFNFQIDLARCLWAILPATLLWGASFPLALAAAASGGQDGGRLVGRVYAANTIGAILGALLTSVALIAWVGTQQTQRILIGIAALSGTLVLLPSLVTGGNSVRRVLSPPRTVGLLLALGAAAGLAWILPAVPWRLIAHGRYLATKGNEGKVLFVGEGMNSSVAVTELGTGIRNFHVSGKIEASTEPQDMRLQRMLGHFPALFHPHPRSVLIVGCGAGVTAGSFLVHPEIEKVTICEIEPLIPQVVATYFGPENYNVVKDPRVHVIYDDARHFVRTTREKFDIITSDPIHPWVKGAATLYTEEYFNMCREHLNPGGMVTQWVPLYESNLNVVKSEVATFMAAFPQGTIWSNDENGGGYDVVLLGQIGASRINIDDLQQRLDRAPAVARSLEDVGFKSALDLLGTYAGRGPDLTAWMKTAEINHDRNLRLQYLAGFGNNLYAQGLIFDDMVVSRHFPEEVFLGSAANRQALRLTVDHPKTSK